MTTIQIKMDLFFTYKKYLYFFLYDLLVFSHTITGDFMNKSIWLEKEIVFDKVTNNSKSDIVIIGGGISGTNALYFLKDSPYKITLLNNTNNNTTCNSTAKITYLQQDIYSKISQFYNSEKAYQYYQSQKDGIDLLLNIIEKEKIDCDLEKTPSYIFTNTKESNLEKELEFLNNHEIRYKEKKKLPLLIPCHKALEVKDTYTFNPYKYIISLKQKLSKYKNIDIYDSSLATSIQKKKDFYEITCNNKILTCKYIVMACHYPIYIESKFPFTTYLERSVISAFPYDIEKPFSMINLEKDVLSSRNYKDYLIFLSNSHNINQKENIEELIKKHQKKEKKLFSKNGEYTWINHDIMTNDHLPIAGKIKDTNIFILTGYNTWGMINSTICAKLVSDLILDSKNKYQDLFDPNRSTTIKRITNDILFSISSGSTLLYNKISKNKDFYKENVKIVKEDGLIYGIYIDENEKEHKVYNLCPHMKCNLIFNYFDKTWDCPCHGSRFDVDGNVIKGPASYSIKIENDKSD